MNYSSVRNLILFFAMSTSFLWAGEARIETKYFMGEISKESTLPTVSPSWLLYSKKKITKFKGGESIELLAGPDKGTTMWEIGNQIVSSAPSGELVISEKLQDGTVRDSDTSWARKLEPIRKDKQNGDEILIYEANGGFRRLWISEKSGQPIAATEGRFITFFQISDDKREVVLPENIAQALAKEKEHAEKLSKMGSMPQ